MISNFGGLKPEPQPIKKAAENSGLRSAWPGSVTFSARRRVAGPGPCSGPECPPPLLRWAHPAARP